jgi:nucleotide-binding universal stress UspA family protein
MSVTLLVIRVATATKVTRDPAGALHPRGAPMSTLARILCAVDLEKASERAFDRALKLAVIGNARLIILHATPANVPFSWRARERLAYLTALRERAEAAGVNVRVEEMHGDPARVIVLHANARKPDIVVLGSNRRRGWMRFREGSVAERVLRRAAWPILIVPWDAPRSGVLGRTRARASSKR